MQRNVVRRVPSTGRARSGILALSPARIRATTAYNWGMV